MSANKYGAFRVRKSDGAVLIRCAICGKPNYLIPDRDFLTAVRYTSKAANAEFVRPACFFVKCQYCNNGKK